MGTFEESSKVVEKWEGDVVESVDPRGCNVAVRRARPRVR